MPDRNDETVASNDHRAELNHWRGAKHCALHQKSKSRDIDEFAKLALNSWWRWAVSLLTVKWRYCCLLFWMGSGFIINLMLIDFYLKQLWVAIDEEGVLKEVLNIGSWINYFINYFALREVGHHLLNCYLIHKVIEEMKQKASATRGQFQIILYFCNN